MFYSIMKTFLLVVDLDKLLSLSGALLLFIYFFSFWKYLLIFLFFLLVGYIYWDKVSQTFVNSSALTYRLWFSDLSVHEDYLSSVLKMQSWGPLPVILLWIWRLKIGHLKKKDLASSLWNFVTKCTWNIFMRLVFTFYIDKDENSNTWWWKRTALVFHWCEYKLGITCLENIN